MNLTPVQLATLKAAIDANTNAIPAGQPFAGVLVNAIPQDSDGAAQIAWWYNQTASPDFFVWRDLPMEEVLNLINFAAMTPSDAVPTTPALTVDVFRARALICQGKQFNLQNLIIGRQVAPLKRANYRAAMQDCLTGIPAGSGGALIAANFTGVQNAAKRLVTRGERLYVTGTGSQASPGDVSATAEGELSTEEVLAARSLP